jgi:hypothetical protein
VRIYRITTVPVHYYSFAFASTDSAHDRFCYILAHCLPQCGREFPCVSKNFVNVAAVEIFAKPQDTIVDGTFFIQSSGRMITDVVCVCVFLFVCLCVCVCVYVCVFFFGMLQCLYVIRS